MRHNVHLFLGEDFRSIALDLNEYIMKYGGDASPYFNVILFEKDEGQTVQLRRVECSDTAQNKNNITFGPPASMDKDNPTLELTHYFNILFRQLVTITNPGDSSKLLLTLYFPLYSEEIFSDLQLIVDAVNESSNRFEIDFVGLGDDLRPIICTQPEQEEKELKKKDRPGIQEQILFSAITLKRNNRNTISHVIPICNVNSNGYALNLNKESLVRMMGELAILFVSDYNRFMRQIVDDDDRDITAIGMSQIYLDEYYFTQYLQHKAFLHVLERENVTQDAVDLNKIAPIAQRCLQDPATRFDVRKIFSEFWDDCKVENLLTQGMTDAQIIAELSPKINKLFDETLPKRLQSFIPDENLSLPERKCILALLLGQDDEQFFNDIFDDNQLFIDDIVSEPLQLFVDENNRHKLVEDKEDGSEIVKHAVLDSPLNSSKDVYVPIDEIRNLKKKILSSSKYIRKHEHELEELDLKIKESIESEKRLSPSGFKFNDKIYKLQYDVIEHALEDTYEAHEPTSRSVDLRNFFSEIRDQGEEGACASFATVSVFEYFQHRYDLSDNYKMSPAFSYYNARMRKGKSVLGKGSSIADNIEAMHDIGLCHEELWEYNAETIDQRPSEEAFTDAKAQTVMSAANIEISSDPDETLKNIKSALCDGFPVLISLKVYDSFSAPNGIIPHPTDEELKASTDDARHALVLCGFSDEHHFFIARNSWGIKFGDKGYCYIPYSYISDKDQCECAFVITKVSPSKSVFKKSTTTKKICFDTTDIAIRRAVIRNLVAEERIYLSRLKSRYDVARTAFEHLFKNLCKNQIRTQLRELAVQRLQDETAVSTDIISALQSQRVEETNNHKNSTRRTCIKCGLGALAFLIGSVLAYRVDFENHLYCGFGLLTIAALMVLFIVLFIPYRKAQRKRLEQSFMEQINRTTDKRTMVERKQRVLPIQLHLAGAFLEQYDDMRNKLMSKYNCMVSFVGNLKVWHEEEQGDISNMNADSRPPFISVLDNNSLDNYFLENAQQATSDIHLADFFNQGYSLNDAGIIKFWQGLISGMTDELMERLNGFSMYKYILNIEDYPFLPKKVKESELLPSLEERSKTFVHWHQYDKLTPVVKYLMLFFENDKEEHKWWSCTSNYFQEKPLLIPASSKFKLIMLEIKNLTPSEIELT